MENWEKIVKAQQDAAKEAIKEDRFSASVTFNIAISIRMYGMIDLRLVF